MSKVLLGDVAVEHKETCKGSKDGYPIVGLEHRPILHKNVCEKTEIKDVVKNWLL